MKKADLAKMPKDYVEPLHESYADFPASDLAPEGMQTIHVNLQHQYPRVKMNVVYAHKDGINLHLQIIEPAWQDDDTKYPLIMWTQGSAFHKQDIGTHLSYLSSVARHGYVIAMVEYRHTPQFSFPVHVRDLNTATRYMLNHANQYHVDPNSYFAWGDSSGAHTSVLTTVTEHEQYFSDEDINVEPLHFKGCIDFYGPMDISRMNKVPSTQDHVLPDSPEGLLFGGHNIYEVPDLVQKGNPINYIKKDSDLPPFIIFHGNKDRLVPFEQSCLLYEALKKNNKKADFYRVDAADHASGGFYNEKVMQIVLQFIEKNK